LIRSNLARNGAADALVVHALLGAVDGGQAPFSLNPSSTLDNRVEIAAWDHVAVPTRSMDSLLVEHAVHGATFIKIDTQGYEHRVMLGLRHFLSGTSKWMLKMEFAPNWLTSQGTDPAELLAYLLEHYEVAEFAERIPYGTDELSALFRFPLTDSAISSFIGHVRSLNRNGLGWVDLIVRPKSWYSEVRP
jgi:FkbM family methyltransferase